MIKILWVHDHFNGPENGLIEYNSQKLWFQLNKEGTIDLLKLTDEQLELVETDHRDYCQETGRPYFYDSEFMAIPKRQVQRQEMKPNPGEDFIDTVRKSMMHMKMYPRKYNPLEITGEHVTTINKTEIENYNVPHRIAVQ